jgi:hypothetical protein
VIKLRREGRWAYYSIDADRTSGYASSILAGIKKSLANDPEASDDLERLKTAERLGPICATGGCISDEGRGVAPPLESR